MDVVRNQQCCVRCVMDLHVELSGSLGVGLGFRGAGWFMSGHCSLRTQMSLHVYNVDD